MPLRDHFRSPLSDRRSWDGFHGAWPAIIVIGLNRNLPQRYLAEPQIHLGSSVEVDVATYDEYEVRVYDTESGSRLVAAIEIVSPSNKDRPESRRVFVAKCAALIQNRVCVAIVDLVTTRTSNLYVDLLELLGHTDPSLAAETSPLYVASCRWARTGDTWLLETWRHPLTLGQPLPTLPLWLAKNLAVPLELELSYEETCRILRIP
jgi:Protein of unknown function (DUF4058)